ncbi:flagellar rod assembly protein/muramidase FlgJ [Betaproteobacteria bacterium]|nr:flagellar rod assembly protein/muramidase FlgJ [Betaproteobacteria bacterium]GHU45723.1 flagellar rod assembly protein/muramidase FlgJ [Betaproteobacteria bacterium]
MAINKVTDAASLAGDVQGARDLRAKFRTDKEAGVKAAAQEFEALFLQMMLKSMRQTTDQDSFMESDASRFYTSMLDEQIAKDISRTGSIGLAKVLEEQLSRRMNNTGTLDADGAPRAVNHDLNAALKAATISAANGGDLPFAAFRNLQATLERATVNRAAAHHAPAANDAGESSVAATPKEFVRQMWPHAVEASRDTGIPPQFLIAHAALESGWGQRDLKNADGSPAYNLFGIKAGASWQGKSTEVTTTEYENGVPVREQARFRSYGSYAEAFADYAHLLASSPRYGGVIGSQDGTEFARRLQQAGYATDPKYAEKLSAIINGATLRQAFIG